MMSQVHGSICQLHLLVDGHFRRQITSRTQSFSTRGCARMPNGDLSVHVRFSIDWRPSQQLGRHTGTELRTPANNHQLAIRGPGVQDVRTLFTCKAFKHHCASTWISSMCLLGFDESIDLQKSINKFCSPDTASSSSLLSSSCLS